MAAAAVVNVELMAQLVTVRSDVNRACELLVTPSPGSLDRCSRVLEAATHRLAESQPHFGAAMNSREIAGPSVIADLSVIAGPSVLGEAYRLRAALRRAASLLEGANGFHRNWSRLRDAMTGGYTGRGDPAPVPRGSRISIRG
jgi:hypothetical protein